MGNHKIGFLTVPSEPKSLGSAVILEDKLNETDGLKTRIIPGAVCIEMVFKPLGNLYTFCKSMFTAIPVAPEGTGILEAFAV